MNKYFLFFLTSFFAATSLYADAVRLKNNSNHKLRVIVEGSDGTHLGEVIIDSHQSLNWTDTYGYKANNKGAKRPLQLGDRSKVPFTITWYCMNGDPYSECTNVAAGSLVMSDGCEGDKACKPKQKSGYPDEKEETEEE